MRETLSRTQKVLLLIGMFLLPVDYFMPTAMLFREAGAKPSILVFTVLALTSYFSRNIRGERMRAGVLPLLLLGILSLGCLAFCVNLVAEWSDFNRAKNPIFQFLGQTAMLILFSAVTIELTQLFGKPNVRAYLRSMLTPIALLHLLIFGLEASGLITDDSGTFLGLFRADEGIIERPTGLMSEPSYFGVFAGIFGLALLVNSGPYRWHTRALAVTLFTSSILISAKTVIPVCAVQLLGLLWYKRDRISGLVRIGIASTFFLAAFIYITSIATFDLEENLSSAMRLGSSMLSLNVATSGYALTGIGFGQFHFFYNDVFAPDFLLMAPEALNQMDADAPGRASTYNLFFRLVTEGGLAALALFIAIVVKGLRLAGRQRSDEGLFACLVTLGSIGFLLTQDTYFYPPLCLGIAMCYSFSTKSLPNQNRKAPLAQ